MKEKILQIVLQNKESTEDIVKIRLVENSKANVAKILKKIGTQTSYQVKKIRLRDKRIVEVIKVKKLNRKVVQFVTKDEIFQVDLKKSKNQIFEYILKVFSIKNNCFVLKTKVKNLKKGLIGVVINSELFIQGDKKVEDIIMNLIACKGRRENINIKGILIKCHENISFEIVSKLEVKFKENSEYLNFADKSQKWEFIVENKLSKNLSYIWAYLFGYSNDKIE